MQELNHRYDGNENTNLEIAIFFSKHTTMRIGGVING